MVSAARKYEAKIRGGCAYRPDLRFPPGAPVARLLPPTGRARIAPTFPLAHQVPLHLCGIEYATRHHAQAKLLDRQRMRGFEGNRCTGRCYVLLRRMPSGRRIRHNIDAVVSSRGSAGGAEDQQAQQGARDMTGRYGRWNDHELDEAMMTGKNPKTGRDLEAGAERLRNARGTRTDGRRTQDRSVRVRPASGAPGSTVRPPALHGGSEASLR